MDAAALTRAASAAAAKLVRGSRPSKDTWPELPDVLRVARVGLGLLVGVACGLAGLTGWSGVLLYALVALGGVRWLCASFLEADEESYGAGSPLLLEGLQPGLAVCLLAWTLLYQFTQQ